MACGSDWPVVPLDAIGSIYAAREGGLSGDESLLCHTAWAAASMGWEGRVGSLVPGAAADLVVLSADPRSAPRDEVEVVQTYVQGELVYSRRAGHYEL